MMLDANTKRYFDSARELNLPANVIPDIAGFEIKLGSRRYYFRMGETPFNLQSSSSIARNKYCTNKRLLLAQFPVAKSLAFDEVTCFSEGLSLIRQTLRFPLVIKPTFGVLGADVICNIGDEDTLVSLLKETFKHHRFMSVEEFHAGLRSYRILVHDNKIIGLLERLPAHVMGDGIHTIQELIVITNQEREQFCRQDPTFGPIVVDEECRIRLKELNITVEYIPKSGEKIVLMYTCNDARGGTMRTLGKHHISDENAVLLCKAAQVLGLNLVGFDVICKNLSQPLIQAGGIIVEANDCPDIVMHEYPFLGEAQKVTHVLLKRLIFKHPIVYLRHLMQVKSGIYLRSGLFLAIFLGFCQLLAS